MGTTTKSSEAAIPKRRSLSFSGIRSGWSPAAGRQVLPKNTDEMARSSVEEAVRTQKAAAWQWYARGVGEAHVALRPTKPPLGSSRSQADFASDDARRLIGVSGSRHMVMHDKIAESNRSASSRFKAEAAGLNSTRPAANGGIPPSVPAPPAPSGGPSTSLYDELELSNLRTHMADFVQRLQRQQTPNNHGQSSPAVGDRGRSRLPPPPVLSTHHHKTKAPPAVAVASSGDHQATKLQPPSPAPGTSTIPFRIRMFSALQKLCRKVQLSESVPKCSKNSSHIIDSATPIYEPAEVLYDNAHAHSTTQSHHHHYIHHHHHHYHFSESPEVGGAPILLSRRRNSESGNSLPCTPSLVDAGSDQEEEDETEENRIVAYLAPRRRRYSDCFCKYQLRPERNAGLDKYEGVKEYKLQRQYNSERFLPNKILTMVGENMAQPVEDEFDEDAFADTSRRRRHSAELHRKEPSLERKDGKREAGAYRLGGAGVSCRKPASTPNMDRRRHSDCSKMRTEACQKQRERMPGKPMY